MKTIGVYYKDIKLGELSQVNSKYIYKANKNNINKAHKLGYLTFLYKCDDNFISEELPYSLQNFIPTEKQIELIETANILDNDNDFEKLYKIAKLNFEKPDFHIEIN